MASEAKAFLAKLQHIVKTNNKKEFASLIDYPIRVYLGGHLTKISSRSDFVHKYSSIIAPDVRHAILAQSADCLFGNYQGMMIGRGQVWFQPGSDGQMRIITITSDPFLSDKK
jgi:hypothetical protein